MKREIRSCLRTMAKPAIKVYDGIKEKYGEKHLMWRADQIYYATFHKHIDWDNPKDINEKINWLKFYDDPYKWADLADKYKVRKYVERKNLSEILVPLLGKWDNPEKLLESWGRLPDEFVLKSNNGCGNFLIVNKEKGGKSSVDLKKLQNRVIQWLNEVDFGLKYAEPHYTLIKNCIFAEALLQDDSTKNYSRSMVDYKIWCFHGVPYGCLVCYDRVHDKGEESVILDYYDIDWHQHSEFMMDQSVQRYPIEKPQNWDRMLEVASILSDGLPQVRVDLYNIQGRIYFGEMTLTSLGGYMNYFTKELLDDMGKQIRLDTDNPKGNLFANNG